MDQSEFDDQLRALREHYTASLGEKATALEQDWQALTADPDSRKALDALILQSHTLAGSGTVFGLPDISHRAKATEDLLRATALGRHTLADQQVADHVNQLISLLRTHSTASNTNTRETHNSAPSPAAPDTGEAGTDPDVAPRYRFLTLLKHTELRDDLEKQLGQYGYELITARDIQHAAALLQNNAVHAIILELEHPHDELGPSLRQLRGTQHLGLPILLITHADDMASRLHAVRAGIEAYFTHPVDSHRILDTIDALTLGTEANPYRVMLVDDSYETAQFYVLQLEQAGMQARVVTDPYKVMDVIADFNPELILLDVYMPEVGGPELAAVIRQQDNFVGTPIVFLSSETDKDKQLVALSQGADDFLTKPITPEHLLAAVRNRVERYRHLRSFMTRDSLTGLLNHTTLSEQLENVLSRSARQNGQLTFAMLDVDHFKHVNDTYGHPTGDRVLKDLARLLRQRLRKSDIIGRYGGEEFAVILTDTDADTAARVLDDLRESFAALQHRAGDTLFTVTLSAGIAAYPRYADAISLTDAADQAMYQSKHDGRNRITVAG